MKQILFFTIVSILFTTPVWTQKTVRTKNPIIEQATISKRENFDLLTEEFSFLIQDFKIDHQSEVNNLNIKVRVQYGVAIATEKFPTMLIKQVLS